MRNSFTDMNKLYPTRYDLEDLSGDYDELSEICRIKNICQTIINYFLDERPTLRQASDDLGFSKSYIHYMIHSYIRREYNDDYISIKRILEYNSKFRRKPRKYWTKDYQDMMDYR